MYGNKIYSKNTPFVFYLVPNGTSYCELVFGQSATDLGRELHWLPIEERVKFKIATLTFEAKRGVPDYLCSLLTDYQPTRTLQSSDTGLLYRPRTHPLILSLTVLRVQHQLSGTHCLLLLGLLIALVLLGLDLKLTYSQKPMPPSVSVTQLLWFGSRYWRFINWF